MRCVYVDILKGFAIFAVVLFHIKYQFPRNTLFNPCILGSLWHVPLFFFISGFFISESKIADTKEFLLSKTKRLYLKGLYYYIPAALLHNLFFKLDWYRVGEYKSEEPIDTFYGHILVILKNFVFIGRENILGAMWFLDCLFLAMVCYALIFMVVSKMGGDKRSIKICLIMIFLIVFSNICTSVWGITILKANNTITALGLIWVGQQMFQRGYCNFVNIYTFIMALFILWNFSVLDSNIRLDQNIYSSVGQLLCITVSAFFTFAFVGKKIENCLLGSFFSYLGKNSFSIMALHFVGFKICSMLLTWLTGREFATYVETTPVLDSFMYVPLYLVLGIYFPILFVRLVDLIKNFFMLCVKKL